MPPKTPKNFSVGDLVFAKVKGYPPWPARIESEPPAGYKAGPGRYPVFFFGTYETAVVSARDLFSYEQNKHKMGIKRKVKNFNEGLEEIEKTPQLQVSVAVENQTNSSNVEPPEDSVAQSLPEEPEEEIIKEEETTKESPEVIPKVESPSVSNEEEISKTLNESETNPSAEQPPIGSDSDDGEEGKLVIDDQVVSSKKERKKKESTTKKKTKNNEKQVPTVSTPAKKKADKSVGARNKRKRIVMEDSSESEAEKPVDNSADNKTVSKDKDSDNPKKKFKSINSSDESSAAEEEKKSRKRKKEKTKSKQKDEKKRKKEVKTKEESEVAKTPSIDESVSEDPEVVEKLKIKLQESKDKEKEIQMKLQEKEKEKERRKQEKKEQKRKEKLEKSAKTPPPISDVLTTIDKDIQDSLRRDDANVERCLEAMERLKTVPITPQGLETYGSQLKSVIFTLKKCRKYRTDERVRQKSDHLYHKFRDFFYTNDTPDLSESSVVNINAGAESSESNEPKDESLVSSETKTTEANDKSSKTDESVSKENDDCETQPLQSTEQTPNNGLPAKEEDIKTESDIKIESNGTDIQQKTESTDDNIGAQTVEKSPIEVPNGVQKGQDLESKTTTSEVIATNT